MLASTFRPCLALLFTLFFATFSMAAPLGSVDVNVHDVETQVLNPRYPAANWAQLVGTWIATEGDSPKQAIDLRNTKNAVNKFMRIAYPGLDKFHTGPAPKISVKTWESEQNLVPKLLSQSTYMQKFSVKLPRLANFRQEGTYSGQVSWGKGKVSGELYSSESELVVKVQDDKLKFPDVFKPDNSKPKTKSKQNNPYKVSSLSSIQED